MDHGAVPVQNPKKIVSDPTVVYCQAPPVPGWKFDDGVRRRGAVFSSRPAALELFPKGTGSEVAEREVFGQRALGGGEEQVLYQLICQQYQVGPLWGLAPLLYRKNAFGALETV